MKNIWDVELYPGGVADHPDLETWKRWRKTIETEVGGLADGFRSEMVLRGYNMIGEMTGKISFIQGWVLAIIGRLPTAMEDRLLNAMIINTALSDPRFWLFRTPRLAATVKSPPSACMAAGLLTNEASFFSSGAAYSTSSRFVGMHKKIEAGSQSIEQCVLEALANNQIISGFGRVLARGPDERNPSLLKVAAECGLDKGKYLQMAIEIESCLQKHKSKQLYINNGGLKCSLLLDLGFSPKQIMLFYSIMFVIGMAGNVAEAYEKPPGEFLPLQKEDIEYTGVPFRRPNNSNAIQHNDESFKKTSRLVVMDTISLLKKEHCGDIVVCGSHGGLPAAEYALQYDPAALFFHDAGGGKENAGTAGLTLCENSSIPAAAVDYKSARIGDGMDVYRNGKISATNTTAQNAGVLMGMKVDEAVDMLMAKL